MTTSTETMDLDSDLVSGDMVVWYLEPKTSDHFKLVITCAIVDVVIGRKEHSRPASNYHYYDALVFLRHEIGQVPRLLFDSYSNYYWRYRQTRLQNRTDRISIVQ